MINILLERYDIDADWLYHELTEYIKPQNKVAVVPFSFRDDLNNKEAWEQFYGKEQGRYYAGIVDGFLSYGISAENITFLNYFSDTKECARDKIKQADVIYFTGGLPDRMMDRIREFDLYDVIMKHRGTVMGVSAGAVIQLSEYHLSPDKDYPAFGYYRGLPFCDDFYLEVHYEQTPVQKQAIDRVLAERGKPVYAMRSGKGAIIVENRKLRTIGQVELFR